MKNRSISRGQFITSLIIATTMCFVALMGGDVGIGETEVASAEEIEETKNQGIALPDNSLTTCATINETMTIDIPCADFSATRFSLALDLYINPADPDGLYFQLNNAPAISEVNSVCAFVDESLNINITCVTLDNGSKYTIFLENYPNSLDNDGLYWKVTESIQQPISYKETDNSSKLRSRRASQPNLTPYKPSGWSDKIVVSTKTGTTTDSSPLYNTDTLYVDWAVSNIGSASISTKFWTILYVDGSEKKRWYTNSLRTQRWVGNTDYSIGKLSVGNHKIKIKTDATETIAESNGGDNEYTKNIIITDKNICRRRNVYHPGTSCGWDFWGCTDLGYYSCEYSCDTAYSICD